MDYRSPGGTPLRTKSQNTGVPDDSDPAAIIARALQKKFSHSVFQDSPGLFCVFISVWKHCIVSVYSVCVCVCVCTCICVV